MLKLIKRYLPSYRIQLILVFVFSILQVGMQLLLPQITDRIIKKGVIVKDFDFIYQQGALMIVMTLLCGAFMLGSNYFSAFAAGSFSVDCRKEMFHKVCHYSEKQFAKYGVATLTNRFSSDLYYMTFAIMMGLRTALTAPLVAIGAIIVALLMNFSLTLILILGISLCFFLIVSTTKRALPSFSKALKELDYFNLLTKEKVTGVRPIRAFNKQQVEEKRMDEAIESVYAWDLKSNNKIAVMVAGVQIILNLLLVVVFFVSSFYVRQQIMQASDLVKFVQYIVEFVNSMGAITSIIQAIPRVKLSSDRILEIVDEDVTEGEAAEDVPYDAKDQRGEIVLDGVSFGYSGSDEKVIRDVSLKINKGETVAFIGTTGAGKSTLISLMMGLYKDYEGTITVNGRDNKTTPKKNIAEEFSFAPQKSMVLKKSIFDNMSLSDADISKDDAEEALNLSCAWEFVNEKDEKMDFELAEKGMNVSGGQRQRLSLARAVAKDADIYVFDDSFSALDARTEKSAREQILEKLSDKTVILIAQRIKTIMGANRIYLMDDGRIVAEGTHSELLDSCELYRMIYKTQFRS